MGHVEVEDNGILLSSPLSLNDMGVCKVEDNGILLLSPSSLNDLPNITVRAEI